MESLKPEDPASWMKKESLQSSFLKTLLKMGSLKKNATRSFTAHQTLFAPPMTAWSLPRLCLRAKQTVNRRLGCPENSSFRQLLVPQPSCGLITSSRDCPNMKCRCGTSLPSRHCRHCRHCRQNRLYSRILSLPSHHCHHCHHSRHSRHSHQNRR